MNYLGYDDHVVLNRSLSFLMEEEESDEHEDGVDAAGGKLLTILTVCARVRGFARSLLLYKKLRLRLVGS